MKLEEIYTRPETRLLRNAHNTINAMGAVGIFILLLGVGFSKAAQNIGMGLALLALLSALTLPGHPLRGILKREPLAWMTGLWILYLVLLAHFTAQLTPDIAADQYDGAWKLSRLFLVLLVGFWVGRSFSNPVIPAMIVLSSFFIGALIFHHDQDWPVFGVTQRRLDFWENPQFYGLLSGTILLGTMLLTRDIVGHWRHWSFGPRLLFWMALLALSLNAFLISEARGSMAGLLVAVLVAGALLLARFHKGHYFTRTHAIVTGVGVVLLAGTLWMAYDRAEERFSRDLETLQQAFSSDEDIRPTNMGIRLVQWQTAVPLWRERPIFGWGPGSGEHLHEQAALPNRYRSAGNHFHNTHLDLALWTGGVGLVLFLITLGTWAVSLWQTFLAGGAAGRIMLFGWCSAIMFLVAGLTQTFITSQVSWFFLGAFLGPPWGIALARRVARESRDGA